MRATRALIETIFYTVVIFAGPIYCGHFKSPNNVSGG
jgi:hypothetical protein